MKRFFSVLALSALFLSCARAEPQVNEQIEYYDISGGTAAKLRAQMLKKGPVEKGAQHFDAKTQWYVSWRTEFNKSSDQCAIKNVSTVLKIIITFPRLAENAPVSDRVRDQFANYAQNLMAHEKGHAQNALDTASAIESGLHALAPEKNCLAMRAAIKTFGNALIREGGRRDVEYDKQTRHGETQGAIFQ